MLGFLVVHRCVLHRNLAHGHLSMLARGQVLGPKDTREMREHSSIILRKCCYQYRPGYLARCTPVLHLAKSDHAKA